MVAELLRQSKGELELIDAREFLPLFRARAGLSTWTVLNDYHAAKIDQNKNRPNNNNRSNAHNNNDKDGNNNTGQQDIDIDDGDINNNDNNDDIKMVEDDDDDDEDGEAENKSNDIDNDDHDNKESTINIKDEQEVINNIAIVNSNTNNNITAATPATANENVCPSHEDPLIDACLKAGITYYPDYTSVPVSEQTRMRSTLFPPTPDEARWMHLGRFRWRSEYYIDDDEHL